MKIPDTVKKGAKQHTEANATEKKKEEAEVNAQKNSNAFVRTTTPTTLVIQLDTLSLSLIK